MIRVVARFVAAASVGVLMTYGAAFAGLERWWLPVSLLAAALLAGALSWSLVRRIWALEQLAGRMAEGDFRERSQVGTDQALAGLGASLNRLADRVDQLLSDQRDLMRTVAHEVRAPVSRMRFRIEMLHAPQAKERARHVDGLVEDLSQIDGLFEELLTYVAFDEFDQERPALQSSSFPAVEAVRQVVALVSEVNPNIAIGVEGDEQARVAANRKLFERAVSNVVRNAVAYGKTQVRVEVRSHKKGCVVDVQDDGPGIPEAERPNVLKPFVRLGGGETKVRGTGLGLAIVSRIMRLHKGALHIVAAPRGGTSCQLVWPPAD